MNDTVISSREREVANDVAGRAMISGWDKAISWYASNYGVPEMDIRVILDKAASYNDKADPSGRIEELDDWIKEKRGSERAQITKLHKLSPGLRVYMEAKKK